MLVIMMNINVVISHMRLKSLSMLQSRQTEHNKNKINDNNAVRMTVTVSQKQANNRLLKQAAELTCRRH